MTGGATPGRNVARGWATGRPRHSRVQPKNNPRQRSLRYISLNKRVRLLFDQLAEELKEKIHHVGLESYFVNDNAAVGAGGDYRQCNPGRCYLHQRLRQIPGYEKIMEVARQRNPNRHLTQPEDVARAVSRPCAIRPPIGSLAIRCI
jgi:hypothetical protein